MQVRERQGITISIPVLLSVIGVVITLMGSMISYLVSQNARITTLENTVQFHHERVAELRDWKKEKERDDRAYQKETSEQIQQVKDLVTELKVILKESRRK